ncbi:hypothetical protein PHYPO_G00099750 [Pangasianodon hypophthalmus]|uniref:Uncharacterized protein n=1 Tax=Pangasianodon hypophthalmus TaxID=310915 RepID=A0A5N5PW23_PANHP|nr:hypothetical protein PHYPO_G00099750 [Pangasianodon hypophthalmus]
MRTSMPFHRWLGEKVLCRVPICDNLKHRKIPENETSGVQTVFVLTTGNKQVSYPDSGAPEEDGSCARCSM